MAEKAKGIRVNALAKELNVDSKAILAKLKEEGLDWAPNHMSTLKLGQAETVREWARSGELGSGGGTAVAVEEAPAKPKRRPPAKKKGDETAAPGAEALEDESTDGEAAVGAPPAPEEAPAAPPSLPRVAAEAPATAPVAPPAPTAPAAEVPAAPVAPRPAVPSVAPSAPVAPPAPAAPPATLRPAATAPAPAAPAAPSAPAARPGAAPTPVPDLTRPPVSRPTITLGPSRGVGPATIERKPVVQAPQLKELQPAQIQGPRVVRVEKADNLPAPRPRRPMGEGGGPGAPAGPAVFRPQTGRGVKISEEEEEEARKKALQKGGGGRTNSNRRRGPDGRRGEAMEKLREFSEADLEERRIRLGTASAARAAFDRHLEGVQRRGTHIIAKTGAQRGEPIEIEDPITVKSLSAALGIKSTEIVRKLFLQGVHGITINSGLDHDTAAMLAMEYGVELHVAQQPTLEEELMDEFEAREPDPEKLQIRPPVVTILGHVDHGKTSLLDKIRNANVAAGEAGGITQHTAAWMVELDRNGEKKRVTFIDTPGHQAFTSMRARGADMTDVVVLVVSAAEGVQPQTIESINHAKAAEVPIVVALNKIDRPDANPDMVLGQLAAQGLNPVEWGGDTEVVRTSATTGQGIPDLIEILDLQAQILELKADPTSPARGVVIESRVDPGLGSVATVLVQDGTLKVGDVLLAGNGYGRIRSLINDRGEHVQEAPPAMPVIVSGLNEMPSAGNRFFVVGDADRARSIAAERQELSRHQQLAGKNQVSLSNLMETIKAGETKTINLIIKADVQGSVETLQKTVTDANTDEVRVRVIHAAVGGINESDVELADASDAVIIGFHVVPDEAARQMAEQRRVEIRQYRVIYEIFDDLKKALSGLLEPEIREKLHGHVEVRQVFKVSRLGNVAGCFVTDGHVQRGSKIRLTRGGVVITEDLAIETLRRIKEDVREVKAGFECGIKLANYDDIKVGDILEAYVRETIQRTL
ncbi:MAG TPA: translation initiation factor IF-2 [Tepidisphaeraceae bacterium]|nr:translation initiation factor IF-2 [Tepidisphaeraceae bacterium]